MHRDSENGMALVNVLAVTALASAVIVAMLGQQDDALLRSQDFADAAQAAQTARSGVRSAVVELRRDLVTAPQTDHPGEPWGSVGQQEVKIEGGTFSLTINDEQSRFNLNNLHTGGVVAAGTFRRIVQALEIPPAQAGLIAKSLANTGPISSFFALRRSGASPEVLDRLASLTTVLPGKTSVNINTADPRLVAILLQNPARAGVLIARRDRKGYLTNEDLRAARVLLPPGLGFTSDHYTVDVEVSTGRISRRLRAYLHRHRPQSGVKAHVGIGKLQWKSAAPG